MTRITTVNGIIVVPVIPSSCTRCGSEEFDFETDEHGTVACCKKCHLMYMGFETIDLSGDGKTET